jgi:hypothetical protein
MLDTTDFIALTDTEAASVTGGGPLFVGIFLYLLNNFDSFIEGARDGYAAASPK